MIKLIAVDWGTSSLRVYLLDQNCEITNNLRSDRGISTVADNNFEAVLYEHLVQLDVAEDVIPIIASGMITSRQGWHETQYVECPAGIEALASSLESLDTSLGRVMFVPGVKQYEPFPDIMRGEETQLAGLSHSQKCVALLPGTHSKWVLLKNERIDQFSTFMTGDLFKAVRSHTILRSLKDQWAEDAFTQGVVDGKVGLNEKIGLLSSLFQTRVKTILDLSRYTESASYLSGLLIGYEIAEALHNGYSLATNVVVIGETQLADHYITALEVFGIRGEKALADIASRGLFAIASKAGLISE